MNSIIEEMALIADKYIMNGREIKSSHRFPETKMTPQMVHINYFT